MERHGRSRLSATSECLLTGCNFSRADADDYEGRAAPGVEKQISTNAVIYSKSEIMNLFKFLLRDGTMAMAK